MASVRRPLGPALLLLSVLQCVWPEMVLAQDTRPVVVLSPGHGWRSNGGTIDPGAVSGDLVEKDITLDVARYARVFLARCPVEVFLTREGDDAEHTLLDLAELVNGYQPTVGISIHVNSAGGSPSGTEAWHTVGGYDDESSRHLATLLASSVAERLSIPNRGIMPETDSRHGGLYIHYWDAPSALVEIGFLQGDAQLLRERRSDFGRSIAQAALGYLGLPVTCADAAVPTSAPVSAHFPGATGVTRIGLLNDGLVTWRLGEYSLHNVRGPYGAQASYPLPDATEVGEAALWEIPVTAPSAPGIYRQVWQLRRGGDVVGRAVTAYLIVLPEDARRLREEVDRRIEELREQGEQEVEEFIEQLEGEAIEWATRELQRRIPCPGAVMLGPLLAIGLWPNVRQRRRQTGRTATEREWPSADAEECSVGFRHARNSEQSACPLPLGSASPAIEPSPRRTPAEDGSPVGASDRAGGRAVGVEAWLMHRLKRVAVGEPVVPRVAGGDTPATEEHLKNERGNMSSSSRGGNVCSSNRTGRCLVLFLAFLATSVVSAACGALVTAVLLGRESGSPSSPGLPSSSELPAGAREALEEGMPEGVSYSIVSANRATRLGPIDDELWCVTLTLRGEYASFAARHYLLRREGLLWRAVPHGLEDDFLRHGCGNW